MSAYDDIYCLQDFGMIAGSYKILYIDFIYANGTVINLTEADSFGCDFCYYGTADSVFSIDGIVDENLSSRMKIEIDSAFTEELGDCCIEYRPYAVYGENTYKLGKGRIVLEI